MITETFLVRGSKLTDNQKRFLTEQGCEIEPFNQRLNSWLIDRGYSITIDNSRARAAWDLIRDPSEPLNRIIRFNTIPTVDTEQISTIPKDRVETE